MLMLADRYLLKRRYPAEDQSFGFRRIDGSASATVLYFLPWHTSFRMARHLGLLPSPYVACYEMPAAIVSAIPEACVTALNGVVDDAMRLVGTRSCCGDLTFVGYSIGVFPAAALAAKVGARLFAVASADRGDLMLWESAATVDIKMRAIELGYDLSDFTAALSGRNPIDQLEHIAAGSSFVVGARDPFIPDARRHAFTKAIQGSGRRHRLVEMDNGHFGTIVRSRQLQRDDVSCPWTMAHAATAIGGLARIR